MIRFFDFVFSLLGLLFLLPCFLGVAILIKSSSRGPVFYRQSRVGLNGVEFNILKFRSMKMDSDKMSLLTIGGHDARVTKIGYYLRKFKIDELPQLLNVLLGEMSIVGPRPEVKKYVDLYTPDQKRVLAIRPGITDWASIKYKNENLILGESSDPEQEYIATLMPAKLNYNLIYINNYGLVEYFKIIMMTIVKLII